METVVTRVSWNVNALIGWFGLTVGLFGVLLQLVMGKPILWLSVFGIVGGALILTFSGPTRTTTETKVNLPPGAIDHNDDSD